MLCRDNAYPSHHIKYMCRGAQLFREANTADVDTTQYRLLSTTAHAEVAWSIHFITVAARWQRR